MRRYLPGTVGVMTSLALIAALAVGALGLFTPGLTTDQTGAVASPSASPVASPVAPPFATPITATGSTNAIIEERVSALETRVTVVEARLDTLESSGTTTSTPSPAAGSEGGPLVISGTGSTVTEDFPLEAGRYQVTIDLALESGIILTLYGPSGSDALFSEMTVAGGTATVIYEVRESGTYFIESQATSSDWTVTFERR